jgi:hypothetical protein
MNDVFHVGDIVTYGQSGERLRIERLWFESFPAYRVPQQVARLSGGRSDFSMRVAHLRKVDHE